MSAGCGASQPRAENGGPGGCSRGSGKWLIICPRLTRPCLRQTGVRRLRTLNPLVVEQGARHGSLYLGIAVTSVNALIAMALVIAFMWRSPLWNSRVRSPPGRNRHGTVLVSSSPALGPFHLGAPHESIACTWRRGGRRSSGTWLAFSISAHSLIDLVAITPIFRR